MLFVMVEVLIGTRIRVLDRARNIHRDDDEAWYVLDGWLDSSSATRSGRSRAARRSSFRAGRPTATWNAEAAPVRYLLVMTGIDGLIEALDGGDRTDHAAIFEEHVSELLGERAAGGDPGFWGTPQRVHCDKPPPKASLAFGRQWRRARSHRQQRS